MTQEEKAKRYDKAIKKAEVLYKTAEPMSGCNVLLETVFPELKENKEREDDNIKETLITFFKECQKDGDKDELFCGLSYNSILAWFEKQNEQNMIPLDKVIKFLDEQLVNDKDEVTGEPFINFQNYGAYKETFISYFKRKMIEKQGEQKPAEYTLEQAASIFLDALSNTPYNNKPITDAQVITKELLKFLADTSSYNPNAVNEPKPAWSEEDENIRQWIISDINKLLALKKKSFIIADKEINWLKSLKECHTWKPSDEQMKGIECTIKTLQFQLNVGDRRLNSLYDDLKKLKE